MDKKENDLSSLPPEFRKTVEQAEAWGGLGLVFGVLSRLGLGRKKVGSLKDQLSSLKEQARLLAALPREFNGRFQSRGWILSESTSVDAAKAAISLAEEGKWEDAEERLAQDYDGDRLRFVLLRLRALKAFEPQARIASEAASLCEAGRFIGAVPLLFIVADGMGQDGFGKSIFSEGVELTELNSLAGQPAGLAELVKEMCRTRKRVNTEPINFPFRNGILHGRDVDFGSRLIAAKLWSLISCLGDVIRARQAVKHAPEPEPSLHETLMKYGETLAQKKLIEEWKPRLVQEPGWRLSAGGTDAFPEASPEGALRRFLVAWRSGNYGEMGRQTVYFDNRAINKRAGEIRHDMAGVTLRDAVIERIEDEAAAITSVDCLLSLDIAGKQLEERFRFRLAYGDKNSDPLVRDHPDGEWRVMPSYQGWILGERFQAT